MDCWHCTCGAAAQAVDWGYQLPSRGQLNWLLLLLLLLLLMLMLLLPPLRLLLLEQAGKLAVQLRIIQGTLLHCCVLPLAPGLLHGWAAGAGQRWLLSIKGCQGWRATCFKRAKTCHGHNACRQQERDMLDQTVDAAADAKMGAASPGRSLGFGSSSQSWVRGALEGSCSPRPPHQRRGWLGRYPQLSAGTAAATPRCGTKAEDGREVESEDPAA